MKRAFSGWLAWPRTPRRLASDVEDLAPESRRHRCDFSSRTLGMGGIGCGFAIWLWTCATGTLIGAPLKNSSHSVSFQEPWPAADFPWFDSSTRTRRWVEPQVVEHEGTQLRKEVPAARPEPPRKTAPMKPNAPLNVGGGISGGRYFAWIVLGAILALLLAVGIGLLILWWRQRKTDEDLDQVSGKRPLRSSRVTELPFEIAGDPRQWRDLAQAAWAQGDYRGSLVWLFSHTLWFLDQRDWIQLHKGKTNRQYLAEARSIPLAGDFLSRLIGPFEQAYFGDQPVARDTVEQAWVGLQRLEAAAEQKRGGP